MILADKWKDYELIDCSNGEKLERWGNVILLRPDPQVIWDNGNLREKYNNINSHYHRSNKGGGSWENLKKTPEAWKISYGDLTFNIKQMGFKHTGLFPEQAYNWTMLKEKIKNKEIFEVTAIINEGLDNVINKIMLNNNAVNNNNGLYYIEGDFVEVYMDSLESSLYCSILNNEYKKISIN